MYVYTGQSTRAFERAIRSDRSRSILAGQFP